MTGRDLLDAIGSVDESLLEHCQKTEQITSRHKILWFWHGRKYVSIAACACLLTISLLGAVYWQHSISDTGDILADEDVKEIAASSDTCDSAETESLPEADDQDGMKQDSKADSIDGSLNENYQSDSGILPSTDISSGTENRVDPAPESSGSAENLEAADNKPAKVYGKNSISPNYSRGITIETVKEIPENDLPPIEANQSGEGVQIADMPSARNLLAQNTVILRGTVKKIQHFHATGETLDVYFSVVSVKVKEVYRADGKGNPQKGEICKVYLPDKKDFSYSGNGISGKLKKGSEAVIMPYIADTKTGIQENGNFFAFLDVSEYYFDAKTVESHLFVKTKTNVLYDTRIYDIPYTGKKATLDDVGNYIREMLKE